MELIIKGLKFDFSEKLNKISILNSLSLIRNNIRVCTVRYVITNLKKASVDVIGACRELKNHCNDNIDSLPKSTASFERAMYDLQERLI